MPPFEMIESALESLACDVFFGILTCIVTGMIVLAALFGSLLVRSGWRWLTRHTWRDVVVSAERKALLAGKARQ